MGVLLGDVHPSELESLDKLCASVRIEHATIRSSVDNSDHSTILFLYDNDMRVGIRKSARGERDKRQRTYMVYLYCFIDYSLS